MGIGTTDLAEAEPGKRLMECRSMAVGKDWLWTNKGLAAKGGVKEDGGHGTPTPRCGAGGGNQKERCDHDIKYKCISC